MVSRRSPYSSETRCRVLMRQAMLARLSRGLRQRHMPMMSQSVRSSRNSAKCEPTIPVIPVMSARGAAIIPCPAAADAAYLIEPETKDHPGGPVACLPVGLYVPAPPLNAVTMTLARAPLPKATSIQLFKSLFLARRSEEYIVKHYPENLMRTPMHMSMGQEFVSVGVCAALEGKADVFASYRSHAAFLAQTHDTDLFFSELSGRASGTGEGKGGSMHLAAPDQGHLLSSGVVATQIPVAVGAAFANMQLRTGRTAVVFFGDGAADAGVFWESVNAAALFRLPVMFVCEDNGYAVDTPREARQVSSSLVEAVKPFGLDTYEDDSGDVESVYSLAKEAVLRAQRDRRPAFLNIKCCRYLEHVGI